jgi:hypothetical protein
MPFNIKLSSSSNLFLKPKPVLTPRVSSWNSREREDSMLDKQSTDYHVGTASGIMGKLPSMETGKTLTLNKELKSFMTSVLEIFIQTVLSTNIVLCRKHKTTWTFSKACLNDDRQGKIFRLTMNYLNLRIIIKI